ncbi:hypothetical protein [Motilibacter aurantiacus]|uniref:hypothetical protein n=1 Tax=Motilibacter aurantiacus TaxID=2714955 RepID=UPI00140DEA28|nr:hypothetical protein [Motilibacter aurantiacus]NHC45616.1 hypothetical protein [Motilibacter aurantiacus]
MKGWHVDRSPVRARSSVDCGSRGVVFPAPSAVTANIYSCSPSAASADTCWREGTRKRVLCLVDPWSRTLTEYLLDRDPVVGVEPLQRPLPIGLVLADGRRCRMRVGGAWGALDQHPTWVGYYSCSRGEVWAAPDSPTGGIDRSSRVWTVQVGDRREKLEEVAVRKALFTTSARG